MMRHSFPIRLARVAALGLVVTLLGLLAWRISHPGHGRQFASELQAHKRPQAPGFALPVLWPHPDTWPRAKRRALADGTVGPDELQGHTVGINFWASWCRPCEREMPRLKAAASRHRGEVIFLGVDVQDFKGDARRFLARFDVNFVSVRDGSGTTYGDYGLTGVPQTFFLDRTGRVVAHALGEISVRELEAGVTKRRAGS